MRRILKDVGGFLHQIAPEVGNMNRAADVDRISREVSTNLQSSTLRARDLTEDTQSPSPSSICQPSSPQDTPPIMQAESSSAPMVPASHDGDGASRLTSTTRKYRVTVEDVPESPELSTQSTCTPPSEVLDIPGWSTTYRSSAPHHPATDEPVASQTSARPCATLLVEEASLRDDGPMLRPAPSYPSFRVPVNVPAIHVPLETRPCQPSTYPDVASSDCDSDSDQESDGALTPIVHPDSPRPYTFTDPRSSGPPRVERTMLYHGPAGPRPEDGDLVEYVWLLRESQPRLYVRVPPAGGASSHHVPSAQSAHAERSHHQGPSEARGYHHTSDTQPMPTYEHTPHVPPLNHRRTFYGRPDGPPIAGRQGQTPPRPYATCDPGLRPAQRHRKTSRSGSMQDRDLHHDSYPFASNQAHPAWSGHTHTRSSTHYL